MRFANTVTVQRSPHEVFEYLADFENVPEWNKAIFETSKTSDGPVRAGTTYKQARSLPSPPKKSSKLSNSSPMRLAIHGGLGVFEGTLTYELESVPEGARIPNSADLEAHGLLKLAAPLASSHVGDAVAANLRGLFQNGQQASPEL